MCWICNCQILIDLLSFPDELATPVLSDTTMAHVSKKEKKSGSKPPKSRPVATSSLSQPVTADAAALAALNAFSPDRRSFALLSLSVDKHRLRVFDTDNGRAIAEYILQTSSARCLRWGRISSGSGSVSSHSKKRKKETQLSAKSPPTSVVILGLVNGSVTFFSPAQNASVLTLSHPTSTSPVLSVDMDQDEIRLWTSSADGVIRLWSIQSGDLLGSWRSESVTPYSRLLLRPLESPEEEESRQLLAAHHAIELLELSPPNPTETLSCEMVTKFAGHVTPVTSMHWISTLKHARFITSGERDRFIQGWAISSKGEGRIAFTASVDNEIRRADISSDAKRFLALSSTGTICVFSTPEYSKRSSTTPLEPDSVIGIVIAASGNTTIPADVVDAVFDEDLEDTLRVTRLVSGARPVFHSIRFTDDDGAFLPQVRIKASDASVTKTTEDGASTQRYKESEKLALGSGITLPHDGTLDPNFQIDDGTLDTEMAELTLGQRLRAMNGEALSDSQSEPESLSHKKKKAGPDSIQVPVESLSRTLIQALHSSDTRLLEGCLRYSDAKLIKNTVRRLPPQLALPLLQVCVDRLARGRGGNKGSAIGSAASSQRGTTMIAWIRAVLIYHSGHLMTMPNLVPKLSSLHSTLTKRLTLQERLLSLNGRLDLALAQVEMRSGKSPAQLASKAERQAKKADDHVLKYVEGDSSDEQEEMEVEVEKGSDVGSVEDIGLGGKGTDESDADGSDDSEGSEGEGESEEEDEQGTGDSLEEDDEEEEESDSEVEPHLNGFIDDEAEESWGSEEDSEDEEE